MQVRKNTLANKPVSYAFMYCNSPSTKKQYPQRLKQFFDYIDLEGTDIEEQGRAFLELAKRDGGQQWVQEQILFYLEHHKQRVKAPKREISAGTLRNYLQPIKTFYDSYMEILPPINWKRIIKSMPRARTFSNDRIPIVQEIRKLCEYPDRRIKPIIYTMCSSGIRVGAWEFLRWKHVIPIFDDKIPGKVIAAKLIVYAGEPEEYETFCTPEAYHSLKDWMDFRGRFGEHITGDSWVMRQLFRVADLKPRKSPRGGHYTYAEEGQQLKSTALNRLLLRAWQEQGLRESLEGGNRRHEFKTAHSTRKYFKTRAEAKMQKLNVEVLMGHSVGLNSNYYRPTPQELLEDYERAIPSLTINDFHAEDLKEQQQQLEQKYVDREKEVEELKVRLERVQNDSLSRILQMESKMEHFEKLISRGKEAFAKLERQQQQQQEEQEQQESHNRLIYSDSTRYYRSRC